MKKIWYAVMTDREDTDWGYGSHIKERAIEMMKALVIQGGYEDAYIVVVDEFGREPMAVSEIHMEDVEDN